MALGFIWIILYNIGLTLAAVLGSPLWASLMAIVPKTRAGFSQKCGFYPNELVQAMASARQASSSNRLVWFHAVSVGEFNAIRTLVERLHERGHAVVVSTTTLTGQTLAKQRCSQGIPVFYFPYDLRWSVHRAWNLVQPDLVVITETEIWPNFMDVADRVQHCPVFLINGRISPSSFKGYRKIRFFMKHTLKHFQHLYVQSSGDGERLKALGAPAHAITVAGNIKFDIEPTTDQALLDSLRHIYQINPEEETVLILASTHPGEDEPLIHACMSIQRDFPHVKIILAPRHPERASQIVQLLHSQGIFFSQRSKLTETIVTPCDWVILDTIGELKHLFALGSIAVMGGSFVPLGGHNPLEPLCQGIPVIFGPHMFNFPEITRLILDQRAGIQCQDTAELVVSINQLLTSPERHKRLVDKGLELLRQHRGTTDVLITAIDGKLTEGQATPSPTVEVETTAAG